MLMRSLFGSFLALWILVFASSSVRADGPPTPLTSLAVEKTVPAGTSFTAEFTWFGNMANNGMFSVTLIEVDEDDNFVRLVLGFGVNTQGEFAGSDSWELWTDRPGTYRLIVVYDPGVVLVEDKVIVAN